MTNLRSWSALVIAALTLAGCGSLLGFDDVRKCEGAECPGGGGDDPDGGDAPACDGPEDCNADAPVCDGDSGTCRACSEHIECEAIDDGAPACSPDGSCVECVLDDHCASEVCNTGDQTCVPEEEVVYMAPDGSTDAACGTRDEPCKRFVDALAHVTGQRDIVKVNPGTYNGDTPPIQVPTDLTVTLLAQDAVIDPVEDGHTFFIGAGATFTMRGGTISGATGAGADALQCIDATSTVRLFDVTLADNSGDGLQCLGTVVLEDVDATDNTAHGINCVSGVSLTMTRGTVSGNVDGIVSADTTVVTQVDVFGNSGFGLSCQDHCTVTRSKIRSNASGGIDAANGEGAYINNYFTGNGAAEGGSVGAIFLWPDSGPVVFAYNTVVDNINRGAGSGGLHCVGGDITSPNNLIHGNVDSGEEDNNAQGACGLTYSNVGGIGVNPDNNIDVLPSLTSGYHIAADASCKDHGNASELTVEVLDDLDGDERPYDEAPDCGCDEYVPAE